MNLNTKLIEFNNKTEEIIILLQSNEENFLEKLEVLLKDRQLIIADINLLEYTKEEFETLANELNLQEKDIKLKELLNNKKINIMKEINNVRQEKVKLTNGKKINQRYMNVNPLDAFFVSKKY